MHLVHKLRLSKKDSKRRRNQSSMDSFGVTDIICDSKEQSKGAMSPPNNSGSHVILTSTLNDDLLALILSFVSYAPWELQHAEILDKSDADHNSRLYYSTYLDSATTVHSSQNNHSPASVFFSKGRDKPKSLQLDQSFASVSVNYKWYNWMAP